MSSFQPTQVPAEPGADPAAPAIVTGNEALRDGVNRCAKCGSTEIRLRPATGRLMCLYCRHEWSEAGVEEAFKLGEGLQELRGTVVASGAQDIRPQAADLITLKCGGCGAEVVVNTANRMSARCHWCRHLLSVNDQVPGGAVPDAVLPFGLTHAQAVEKIRKFASGRRMFAHARFKQEFTPENVVGVYMPYLVVDANASAELWGQGEIQTARYTRGNGKNKQTFYDADVYRVERRIDFTVDDLTIESSAARANLDTKASTNNIINTILPFDTQNAVKWNASYLEGYTSEKRDRDVAAIQPVLDDQLLSIARAQVRPSVARYDRGVRWEQEKLDVRGTRWIAMVLPVWLYSYYHEERGRGMVHYIAVNGRTGETMGSVPLAKGRLLFAALTFGTFLEAIAIAILARSS